MKAGKSTLGQLATSLVSLEMECKLFVNVRGIVLAVVMWISLFILYMSPRNHNGVLLHWKELRKHRTKHGDFIHVENSTKFISEAHGLPGATSSKNHKPSATTRPNKTAGALSVEDISDVEKFVFFVGYPRSGHSIVGSMLDAHPNMIVAHEFNLFHQLRHKSHTHSKEALFNLLYTNSYNSALNGWRSGRKERKGYTLEVRGGSQGRFTKLKVIGDKSGGQTGQEYEASPSTFVRLYRQLKQTVGVPVRAIHVVRNPYDMISTRVLYRDKDKPGSRLSTATEEHKYNNTEHLVLQVNRTFELMLNVWNMIRDCKLTVLDIHIVDLIHSPRDTLQRVCDFLDLECPEDYLQVCTNKAYTGVSKTRLLVEWPQPLRQRVSEQIQRYSYFQGYTFEGD